MNIFVVDHDPVVAAQSLCDKHVVKMIVETAQMASTVHRVMDGNQYIEVTANNRKVKRWQHPNSQWDLLLCKAVMVNHPCTKWAFESLHNYNWLVHHGYALCKEYTHRYNKEHKMQKLYENILYEIPHAFFTNDIDHRTEYAQAMPDKYKVTADAVAAYRQYYIHEKSRIAKWTHRETPLWFTEGLLELNNSKGQIA
jgi:hypothetical protein